jgi:hypothetical protein
LTTRTARPAKSRIGIGWPSIEVKAKSCAERGSADAIPAVAASHAIAAISTRIITGLPSRLERRRRKNRVVRPGHRRVDSAPALDLEQNR